MAVSKVIYGDQTLIDLTNDTVAAENLLEGFTAHGADGVQILGTATGGGGSVDYLDVVDGKICVVYDDGSD